METNPKFYLELARVTGCTWPGRGEENDPILDVDPTELDSIDPSQFVRLSRHGPNVAPPRDADEENPAMRGSLPRLGYFWQCLSVFKASLIRFWLLATRFFWMGPISGESGPPERPSWRTVKSHCRSVYQSEGFYRCISEEQWLRTVVTCNSSDSDFSVHSIHSNVMPKQAYLTWFEGIKGTCPEHRCSLGLFLARRLLRGTCPEHLCSLGFFPARRLLREMMELNTFPGLCCSNCAFEDQLRHQLVAAELVQFRYLKETDVRVVDDHTEARFGSEGEIRKILWRHGTFARKRFKCDIPYQNVNFKSEFDVAVKVSHPNIVHCFGWSDGSSNCSLFMEWLEVDLRRFLCERGMAPFSFQETLVVLLQVAEAVKHLHEEGFVHGDLKLENLLLSELAMPRSDAHFYLVKVTDFGCTQRVNSSGATVEPFSYGIGSKKYIAPEVWRCRNSKGSEPPECLYKIDVYSFGVVAYQVVTGVQSENFPRGFSADSVMKPDGDRTQWRPNRDFDFDALGDDRLPLLIKRCWRSSPHDRPTFQEICRELRELQINFPRNR